MTKNGTNVPDTNTVSNDVKIESFEPVISTSSESGTSEKGPEWKPVSEGKKLVLAQWCLGVLAAIFFVSMVFAILCPDHGTPVFEAIQKIIPPFATLILGYYFARNG